MTNTIDKEKNREYSRRDYRKHYASRKAKRDAYRKENKDKINAQSRKYRQNNIERVRENERIYSRNRYYLIKDKKNAARRERHIKQRIDFLTKIGDCKCKNCAFSDWRALQIDHVDGRGALQRREIGVIQIGKLKKLIDQNPSNYQVLCANCNWIKRYENNESRNRYTKLTI